MITVTIRPREKKPYQWNSDKTIDVFVDGKKVGWFWGCSIKGIFAIIKKSLGVKRAKKEIIYG